MKELFIHIGTHKTGTSAIQNFMERNSLLLAKHKLVGELNFNNNIFKLVRTKSIDSELVNDISRHIADELKATEAFKLNKFLLSFEGLSGDRELGYKNSHIIAEHLYQIVQKLPDITNIKIIIYIRRQDDFIESLYTQTIKEGGTLTFKEFLEQYDENCFNWDLLIQSYEKVFGKENIIIKRYDKKYLVNSTGLLKDFLDILGIHNINKIEGNTDINLGITKEALEVQRTMNKYFNENEKLDLRMMLEKTNSKKPFENFSLFSSLDDREIFLKNYVESNNKVSEKYFDRDSLFSPISENHYTITNSLSMEHILVVIMKIIMYKDKEISNQKNILNDVVRVLQQNEKKG